MLPIRAMIVSTYCVTSQSTYVFRRWWQSLMVMFIVYPVRMLLRCIREIFEINNAVNNAAHNVDITMVELGER